MGKVAKALGVGVKGALEVVVDRNVIDAGDLIEGVVVLRVTRPIQCRDLVLSVEGTEDVVWWERHGETSTRHHRSNDFLRDKLDISTQDAYEPGEYSFTFSYRFHESLPASFAFSGRSAGWMRKVSASIAYSLKASLPVTTNLSADLGASQPVALFAQRFAHPVRPVSRQASNVVRTMGVVSRGECEISAQMDQDVGVSGDFLLIQTTIHNRSTVNMSSISLKLYEHLQVDVPTRNKDQGSMCVCQTTMSGVRAGDRQDQVLSLPLVTKSGLKPINPTTLNATFVQWTYKLVIKCKFAMATGVQVEIPVVVLPRANPRETDGDGEAAAAVVVEALEVDGALAAGKSLT